jgi:hypothetical protein
LRRGGKWDGGREGRRKEGRKDGSTPLIIQLVMCKIHYCQLHPHLAQSPCYNFTTYRHVTLRKFHINSIFVMTREFQGPKLNDFTAYMFVFSTVRNCKI